MAKMQLQKQPCTNKTHPQMLTAGNLEYLKNSTGNAGQHTGWKSSKIQTNQSP